MGTTVTDYLPAERERGITITAAAITFPWREHRVNLIDTPGHVDFTIEVERSMRVLDGAVTVLDGVAGVEAQTETVWRQADRYSVPRLVFVNKMDREGADFYKCLQGIHSTFGCRTAVLNVPVPESRSVLDVVEMQRVTWDDSGLHMTKQPCHDEALLKKREELVEACAELDDPLMQTYMEATSHTAVPPHDIRQALRRLTLNNSIVPVLCGSAYRNVSIQPLLDAIVDYLPCPLDRPPIQAQFKKHTITLDVTSPHLAALAFKVVYDLQRGPMVYLRVYSGTLESKAALYNTTTGQQERVQRLAHVHAGELEDIARVETGNIAVALGLKHTRTGDTIIHAQDAKQFSVQLGGMSIPPPVFFRAVEPESAAEERHVNEALSRLVIEDPSLHVTTDVDSGQTLLSGMGELHLQIAAERLTKDWKVKAEFGDLRVAYRETLLEQVASVFEYDKVMGGKPVQVSMRVELSPSDVGNDVSVGMQGVVVKDSQLLNEMRDSITAGVQAALLRGPMYGFPLYRVRVAVSNIQLLSTDVGESALYACAMQAMSHVLQSSVCALVEPTAHVMLRVPQESMGGVMADLNGTRAAHIHHVEMHPLYTHIDAYIPMEKMIGYANTLRSLTAGKGTLEMRVTGYERLSGAREAALLQRLSRR
jgi:elongation factor G